MTRSVDTLGTLMAPNKYPPFAFPFALGSHSETYLSKVWYVVTTKSMSLWPMIGVAWDILTLVVTYDWAESCQVAAKCSVLCSLCGRSVILYHWNMCGRSTQWDSQIIHSIVRLIMCTMYKEQKYTRHTSYMTTTLIIWKISFSHMSQMQWNKFCRKCSPALPTSTRTSNNRHTISVSVSVRIVLIVERNYFVHCPCQSNACINSIALAHHQLKMSKAPKSFWRQIYWSWK